MATSWSAEDKRKLLWMLHKYGASNLELIEQKMPHKTISEIRYICEKHTKLAYSKWDNDKISMHCKNKDQTSKSWFKIFKNLNISQRGAVQDIIPRVLKYIALFEKRTETTHINLRDCYMVLADISNGMASKKLDEMTNYFFFECLTKLAEALQAGETESLKQCLKTLSNLNNSLENKSVETKNVKDSAVLNPLGIPEKLLKMSDLDQQFDIFE